MSSDVKFFTACDHQVNGTTYESPYCPRCYGKGYYLDVSFDASGDAVTTSGSIKLQQEMLKVLLDKKGSDVFDKNFGSDIYLYLGHKKLLITKSKLEMAVRRAIEYLKKVQENEADTNATISSEEIFDSIKYIEITAISITGWKLNVYCSNMVSEVYSQSIDF